METVRNLHFFTVAEHLGSVSVDTCAWLGSDAERKGKSGKIKPLVPHVCHTGEREIRRLKLCVLIRLEM